MAVGGVEFKVDSSDLRKAYVDLKAAGNGLPVALRRGLNKAAEPCAEGVRRAASWSTRIPGAVKVKTSFAARGAKVVVIVDPKIAPEAAALNNKDRDGTFRHPVFADASKPRDVRVRWFASAKARHLVTGGGWTWVEQPARPFMRSGAMSGADQAEQQMLQAIDELIRQAGFH